MCGFLGILGDCDADNSRAAAASALRLLRHRGPDDEGIEAGPNWTLGFRRLSILDLTIAGHQPMFTPERDAAMVFNGEIYNFRELRAEMLQRGETFRSTGDAEVLLRLLRRDGRAALDRLNGMFSVAFVDLRTRRFLLARDRLGVKPLHYAQLQGGLAFASELPALLALLPRQPEISRPGLNGYIAFGHISPPHTIWDGVCKLPPGSYIEGGLDRVAAAEPRRWWQLPAVAADAELSDAGALEHVDELLSDATSCRMVSDVPVGVFLSGGIDSGLVSHYASQAASSPKPIGLTVDFDELEFSEMSGAAAIAAVTGLRHQTAHVSIEGLADLPIIAWHCGEPFADASVVNQFFLAKTAKSYATVFLTGDGGDEAFGGYDQYVKMARWGRLAAILASAGPSLASIAGPLLPRDSLLLSQIAKLSGGPGGFGALVRQNFRDPIYRNLLHKDWLTRPEDVEAPIWTAWNRTAGLPLTSRLQRLDYEYYLESDVLVKVDRATMAWAVEARSPFLDHRVVALAARISPEHHVSQHLGKRLLRSLMARHVPGRVAGAPKRGFGLPIRRWFNDGLTVHLAALMRERPREWWNHEALAYLFAAHARGRRDMSEVLWRVLMLEMWARVFIDRDVSAWETGKSVAA